jgi:phosphoribosylaminoimidazole-succinocarboxamide synthase
MSEALLNVSIPGLKHRASGKVREIFEDGERLVLVATDRLSAFDVVMRQGVPGRGITLTKLSEYWFRKLEPLCPHHLLTTDVSKMPEPVRRQAKTLAGRTMQVRKVEIVPVECVVRGYLAGSGWKEYRERRTVCGVALPPGLQESSRLPEPIFTPTTKEKSGHDVPMTFAEVEGKLGRDLAAKLRDLSLKVYRAGADHAASRGILLADTKFEFGLLEGRLVLADECLTPDSSRYWEAAAWKPGRGQESFDKQIVRDWLEKSGWNKTPPPPDIPQEILEKAASRYREIAERLMS